MLKKLRRILAGKLLTPGRIVVGLCILIVPLACGLIAAGKTAGVILAWGGGIFGTFLLYPILKLLVPTENRDTKEDIQVRDQRIKELQTQRINTDGFQAHLKISLGSVDCVLRDISRRRFNEAGKEIPHTDPESKTELKLKIGEYEYVGFNTKTFKVNLGVNLHAIRVKEEGDTILVSNPKVEWQGFEQLDTQWPLCEIRRQERTVTSPVNGELVVYKTDPRLNGLREQHDRELQSRLNQGSEHKAESMITLGMAQKYIAEHLVPRGKAIRFVDTDFPEGQGLFDYVEAHNRKLDTMIESIQKSSNGLPATSERMVLP